MRRWSPIYAALAGGIEAPATAKLATLRWPAEGCLRHGFAERGAERAPRRLRGNPPALVAAKLGEVSNAALVAGAPAATLRRWPASIEARRTRYWSPATHPPAGGEPCPQTLHPTCGAGRRHRSSGDGEARTLRWPADAAQNAPLGA